jgi:hypothetical protein
VSFPSEKTFSFGMQPIFLALFVPTWDIVGSLRGLSLPPRVRGRVNTFRGISQNVGHRPEIKTDEPSEKLCCDQESQTIFVFGDDRSLLLAPYFEFLYRLTSNFTRERSFPWM